MSFTLLNLRHQLIQTISSILDNSENNPEVCTTDLWCLVLLSAEVSIIRGKVIDPMYYEQYGLGLRKVSFWKRKPVCTGRAIWPRKPQECLAQELHFLCQSMLLLFTMLLGIYNFDERLNVLQRNANLTKPCIWKLKEILGQIMVNLSV